MLMNDQVRASSSGILAAPSRVRAGCTASLLTFFFGRSLEGFESALGRRVGYRYGMQAVPEARGLIKVKLHTDASKGERLKKAVGTGPAVMLMFVSSTTARPLLQGVLKCH